METKIFVFGNGNLSFKQFIELYTEPIRQIFLKIDNPCFILCDYKGVDTLTMEFLKCETANVSILHIGTTPRYSPDKYKTKVSLWNFIGSFQSDSERDNAAISLCTHFLAYDFNSNEKRKSGTLTNIETCLKNNKIDISTLLL